MDNISISHYVGLALCGHCDALAVWKLVDSDGFNDYECDEHAREWWPNEMYNYDQSVEAMEFIAAQLEWRQAERDYSETFKAFNVDRVWGSPLDYAVWSTARYADAAQAAYMNVSIGGGSL